MNPTTSRQRIGLALGGVLSVLNIVGGFFSTPDGQEGPPRAILVLGSVLGLVGLVAVVLAWRTGNRVAVRVLAGTLIVSMLTSLPAFFVDVPAVVKLGVGVSVLVTVAAIVMIFSPSRETAPALD